MKIKRLEIVDLRCFRGQRTLDFTDPATGAPRERVVFVGSNGSGKTTVFDLIEALLRLLIEPTRPAPLLDEAGLVAMTLEVADAELTIAYGSKARVSDPKQRWPEHFFILKQKGTGGKPSRSETAVVKRLRQQVADIHRGEAPLSGGFLYFPDDRRLKSHGGGPIEPPPTDPRWIFRFSATEGWPGSLEQLWVWENYRDLEHQTRGEPSNNLLEAVRLLEAALGPRRKVIVREGRVHVEVLEPSGRTVHLDQLPSGEKQCVILLGELARRRRPGAILAIDEPELSLHPTLQRKLLSQLRRVARSLDLQTFLATHAPEIVRSVSPSEVLTLDYPDSRFDLPVPEGPDVEST